MKQITTDPQEELLTEVDEHNTVIGSIPRGIAHSKLGVFYRTIMVIVKNTKGEIMLQKRSASKDLYSNCWDLSVGGHVDYGNSYEDTAVREIEEELGIQVTKEELIIKGDVLVKLPHSGEFFKVFEYTLKPEQTIKANQDEVNDCKWMSLEDIKKSISEKTLQWYARPEQIIKALY